MHLKSIKSFPPTYANLRGMRLTSRGSWLVLVPQVRQLELSIH